MSTRAERVDDEDDSRITLQAVSSYARELDPKLLVLRRVTLFAELEDDALSRLAKSAVLRLHVKGDVIVRQGEFSHSLMVVVSGVAEAVLESPGGEAVRLREFKAGDYFGEVSLLDGRPRSASAIAVTECQILELDRESVLPHVTEPVTRKLLVELASRVRRTDATVTELTDKVYRAAYANVHAAVSVELETIRTLYQRTEHRSNHTLEQAEQRAVATAEHADRVVANVQKRIDAALELIKKRIAPVITVLVALLGFLGVKSYLDLQGKYKEALGWHDAMGRFQARMQSADKSLRVISETMTSLRSAREAAALHESVDTPAELRRAALDFENAKTQLYQRYIADPRQGPRYESYDPEVVYEAVDTFVTLAAWGRSDGQPSLKRAERRQLLGALSFVLRNLNPGDDTGGAQWLLDRKLRDRFYQLAERTAGDDKKELKAELEDIVAQPARGRARDNAALIIASLQWRSEATRDVLAEMMTDSRPWRSATGAIALAKQQDANGWKQIKRGLDDGSTRYAFASLLAQEGHGALRRLAQSFREGGNLEAMTAEIRTALETNKARNCYEQRYDRWLVSCLDGPCAQGDGPIGGDCTLTGT